MFPAASGNLNAGVGNGNGQQEQIAEAGNGDGGGVSPSPVDSGATAVSSGARLSNTSRHAAATMAPIAPVTTSTPSQYLSSYYGSYDYTHHHPHAPHPSPHAGHPHHGYSMDAAASAWHAAAYATANPLGHFYRTGAAAATAPGCYDPTMADWAAATGHYAAAAASTAAAASACDAIGVDPLQHSMEASSSMTSSSAAAIGNHAASVTPPKSEYKVNVSELGQAISPDETKDSGLDGVSSPESPAAAAGGVGGTGNNTVAAHLNDLLSAQPNSGTSQQPPRPHPARSPYEWIKRPNFSGRTPATKEGKTRTPDKYRVVYTDHQRLELEKEYQFSKYITIRRKAELAQALSLSERQVKIWFQNRRAKERKQVKKCDKLIAEEKFSVATSLQHAAAAGMFGMPPVPPSATAAAAMGHMLHHSHLLP